MDLLKTIVQQLPYDPPFLFVDEITHISEEGCEGFYTFREDEFFYRGHFKDHPVTPGVILTECMAQIGLVCLGIYLEESLKSEVESLKLKVESSMPEAKSREKKQFVFSESHVLFEKTVYPGETVKVVSRKKYWRLGKLKCQVEMFNESGERVCRGELAGMMA